MSKSPIDKLDELVPQLIDETRQLREDNVRLRKEIKTCLAELERSRREEVKLRGKIKRLVELENVQKKMEKSQSQIRSTVVNLLEGIDKIGIAP